MDMTTPRYSLGKQIAGLFAHSLCARLRRIGLLGVAGALLGVLAGAPAIAQTGVTLPPNAQKVPVSLPHLYWHFLVYQNHLDQVAAQRQQQGKDGSYLRNHFQQKLSFTDAQFAVVRSTAQRLQAELKGVDAQAKAIIDADRAANTLERGAPHTWRPVPPELRALQQQHEDLIQSEVSNLKGALGPELAARLDAFLQSRVAPKASAETPHPGPTSDEIRKHLVQATQKQKEAQQ
jgi:hypothetical protein